MVRQKVPDPDPQNCFIEEKDEERWSEKKLLRKKKTKICYLAGIVNPDPPALQWKTKEQRRRLKNLQRI